MKCRIANFKIDSFINKLDNNIQDDEEDVSSDIYIYKEQAKKWAKVLFYLKKI